MESQLLRYFREVYRHRSIRGASQTLNVAPSAVSRQILRLEHEVGLPLFERGARGVEPTEAGDVLAGFARDVRLGLDRVLAELDALRGLRGGRVRILSTEGLVAHFLTRAIAAFLADHPGVAFRLSVTGTDLVTVGVLKGEADIGLAFNAEPDPQLAFALRIRDPLAAVVAPGHPLARRRRLALAEVLDHACGVPEPSFGIRWMIDAECKAAKLPLRPTLETDSIEALRGFARSGAGVIFMPSLPIRRELEAGALVSVPLRERSFGHASHDVCILAHRTLPPASAAFLGYLGTVTVG
jgi:DNA-binding transcriptional LysR family regulator